MTRKAAPSTGADSIRSKADRSVDGSPNRLDAVIWALTRLSKIVTNIPIT
jgi:hypothetical protein